MGLDQRPISAEQARKLAEFANNVQPNIGNNTLMTYFFQEIEKAARGGHNNVLIPRLRCTMKDLDEVILKLRNERFTVTHAANGTLISWS